MTSLKKTPKKRKYEKMKQLDHILHRPDSYVGAVAELGKEDIFIADINSEKPKVVFKNSIKISDAIVRIFVEILSNAIDNIHRSNEDGIDINKIKINVNRETNEISIYNDGTSIPIYMHETEKTRIPELIFGNLLTSDNYNDDEERFRSGRNGFGAKLTNIFSTKFFLEIVHIDDDGCYYSYKQAWKNNMKEVSKPKIKEVKEQTPYTKISWIPDFKIFGGDGYNDTTIAMYYRLIYDSAMIASFYKVSVYLNNKKVPIKSLTDYAKLFETTEEIIEFKTKDSNVVLCSSNSGFKHISFTNGIFNVEGGVHVNKWCGEIFKPILAKFNKKNKIQITIKDIQKHFKIFINCNLPNPRFKSQSKHCLSGPVPTAKVEEKQLKSIMKWSFVSKVNDFIESKDLMSLKRKERKSKTFKSIPGYDPANNAGTKHSKKCTIILTEGLSAKTYAVRGIEKGINNVRGRDWFGIFPLKGKLLNVRNCKSSDIAKNTEITNAMNAIGLKVGVDYTKEENFEKLNYGKVCMLCDQDVDGLHISGLIINFIHKLFPTLLQRKESFVTSMDTPLVRVFDKKITKVFYNEKVFKEFIKDPVNKKLSRKYHKGLGTSSNKEVIETFGERMLDYKIDEKTDENMNMLFDKKNSNQRKKWLADNTTEEVNDIDENATSITFSDFIDKRMIQFSTDDCSRSIPNLFDGLKESQRKILYSVFLKNLSFSGKTLKVAQLAGYVAEKSAYHHGEQCLNDTIVKLANDIIGYNNIPLLFRDGQFATRLSGKDAAAGRYIFTKIDKLTRLLFPTVDDNLLEYNYEDGEKIEPKFYLPILPNILVNGCFAPDTLIPLFSGGTKRADEIIKGDILIGDNGEPRTVQELYQGEDTMYTINQKIGESYTVNSQHILTLKNTGDRSIFWYENKKSWKIEWFDNNTKSLRSKIFSVKKDAEKYKETIEGDGTVEISVSDYLKIPKYIQKRLRGYKGLGANWSYKSVLIDPYILGMWLGDGDSNGRGFSTADEQLALIWKNFADNNNMEIIKDKHYSHSYHYYLRPKKVEIYHPFKKLLNNYGMVENKHIPDIYIYNSKEVRLSLLAGLIDTDSNVYHNGEQITISQCPLGKNILESAQIIARSLGFYTNLHSTIQTIKNKKYSQYTLSISGIGLENIPTVLDRCSMRRDTQSDFSTTPIEVVEKGKGLYYGWSVDGNKRFVLNDFTITHNCSAGIGTGWSSSVPLYNPLELSNACRQWMDSKFDDVEEPMPWYRNFKGTIEKISKNKFISKGVLTRSGNKVEILELPVGVWTDKYKEFLEGLLENKLIKSMKNYSTPQEVRFVITEHKNGIKCNLDNMKLTAPITNSNMVLFLENKKLKKFGSVKEIIQEFSIRRLKLYDDRKAYLLKSNEYQKSLAENKKRFLNYVITKKLVIYMKPEQKIIEQLEKHKFDKKGKNNNYEYILSMDMRSFTKEKIDKLQEEINKLTNVLESIHKTSSRKMWKTELTKFEKEYKKLFKIK